MHFELFPDNESDRLKINLFYSNKKNFSVEFYSI
jgi:hypothetical protein